MHRQRISNQHRFIRLFHSGDTSLLMQSGFLLHTHTCTGELTCPPRQMCDVALSLFDAAALTVRLAGSFALRAITFFNAFFVDKCSDLPVV